jgi:hypothetical protein
LPRIDRSFLGEGRSDGCRCSFGMSEGSGTDARRGAEAL